MRIAMVAPFGLRAKGSTRGRVLPLAKALARRGYEIALLIPPYDSPQDSGRCWTEEGVAVQHMHWPINEKVGKGGGGARRYLALAMELWRAVRAWQPRLVHVFKPKGPSGLIATMLWLTRSLTGKRLDTRDAPLLVVDADDWEGPGGWNDDPRLGYTRWQRWFFAWQERFGLSHADAWTVASACLRERAIGFGAKSDRVFVVPNGVEPDAMATSVTGLPIDPRSVVLYTRFAGVRPADVAAVWLRVREELPDARLTVVGRGLAGEEEVLSRLPGVELKGWVEGEELANVLRVGSVALVPWADTPANRARSSVKVRQLMDAGLAIVGYAVGELPATLADSAILVPAGDTNACARAVVGLLRDPLKARELGERARARVIAYFAWDRLAEAALAAYAAAGLKEK